MEKLFIALVGILLACTTQAQQVQEKKETKSRLDGLEKLYKFSKAQLTVLDSVRNPVISVSDIKPSTVKKLNTEGLSLTQIVIPTDAQVLIDSLGAYNEVVTYKAYTTIISDAHEKGSLAKYNDRIKEEKKKIAAQLRAQADKIEKED